MAPAPAPPPPAPSMSAIGSAPAGTAGTVAETAEKTVEPLALAEVIQSKAAQQMDALLAQFDLVLGG